MLGDMFGVLRVRVGTVFVAIVCACLGAFVHWQCASPEEVPVPFHLEATEAPEPPDELKERLREIEQRRRKEREKERRAEKERCPRHELDPLHRYKEGVDGNVSEEEWLQMACYEQRKFFLEHMHCSFNIKGKIPLPEKYRNNYPCRFSEVYRELHGLPKDGGL